MKKRFLFITCTLLLLSVLTGCKDSNTVSAPNSTDTVSNSNAEPESKEEQFKELIVAYPVTIQGLRWRREIEDNDPDVYYMYMTEPDIIEVTKKTITATGILSDQNHATEDTVTVQYTLDNGSIIDALSTSESPYILTPAIQFLSEDSKESIYRTLRRCLQMDEFTPENYPLLEFGEGEWETNYCYFGTLLVTDKDGKKYTISTIPYNYSTPYDEVDWKWESNVHCSLHEVEQ